MRARREVVTAAGGAVTTTAGNVVLTGELTGDFVVLALAPDARR
jgi:hypothetical protein